MDEKKTALINAVDLFCGAGGLTYGLAGSGIAVHAGVDTDESCIHAYESNNQAKFINQSVADISGKDLEQYFMPGELKLLAGCAPCQTFSSYNRSASPEDQRWWLLLEFLRLVKEIKPELVTMENVPGLARQQVFTEFISGLKELGYEVSFQIVSCTDYGIAQTRRRLVLLASMLGPIELSSPADFSFSENTVRSVIGNLPPLGAGEHSREDPLHKAASLSPKNLDRIRASQPGGTWKSWDESLLSRCHTKATGSSYTAVYGRMEWDKPSPTITTQYFSYGSGRFGHPEQDRAISLREGALLQGFPESYSFLPDDNQVSLAPIGRMIGNAVPVQLGRIIGHSLVSHVMNRS